MPGAAAAGAYALLSGPWYAYARPYEPFSLPSSIFVVGEKKNIPVCFHAVGIVLASCHSLPACGLPPAIGPTRSMELANGNTTALMRSSTDRSLSSLAVLTAT